MPFDYRFLKENGKACAAAGDQLVEARLRQCAKLNLETDDAEAIIFAVLDDTAVRLPFFHGPISKRTSQAARAK